MKRISEMMRRMSGWADRHAGWATVGTANLDYRSLFVNGELNLVDEGGELNAMLARIFLEDLHEAEEVIVTRWSRRPWPRRVAEAVG
ncbi:MAG: hypothetical protein ABIQ84_10025 [Usitatibacter sp.]